MDPTRPETYSRRVLVTVSGLTPQIITETLYALAMRSPPFIPTEVHVITTEVGRQRFDANIEHFREFFREYELPMPGMGASDVHVIAGPDGKATDVRTPADNDHLGNLIMRTVLKLTGDPLCAVHASIAGGRKTMGFYLGYMMSMFGRDQDRISHVLVHEDFENLPDFFYPPRAPRVFKTRDERQVISFPESVLLSEIPFVLLRGGFSDEDLRREDMTFAQLVERWQLPAQPAALVIDVGNRKVVAGDIEVPMQDKPLAFLAWLADCRKRHIEAVSNCEATDGFFTWYERVLNDPFSGKFERAKASLGARFDKDEFRERVRRVNEKFEETLGKKRAAPYSIKPLKRGSGHYALTLPATAITIVQKAPG